ncbi:MAG: AbrB family transcriptional regulator [bacterium]|nr:AbrB family transcriptional regulator [bacterium]
MSKNKRPDETKLQPATSTGNSLRATVPGFIINQFDLKKGDKLRWSILNVNDRTLKVEIEHDKNKS